MDVTQKQKLTQKERILEYIKKNGSIDRDQSYRKLGVFELAARIKDLERSGFSFEKEMKRGKNRFGDKFNYTEYRLKQYDSIKTEGK